MIEAVGWKLAAEFHRRHPDGLSIIETHPGGGQYDCLSFVRENSVVGHLNRVGGFTPEATARSIQWGELWPRCVTNTGLGEVLDAMSTGCGFEIPNKLPPTRPSTLCYRIIASVSAALAFELGAWEWRNGTEDTSGHPCPDSRDEWFGQLSMDQELRTAKSEEGCGMLGRLRYWFLLKDDYPVCCISDEAKYWNGCDSTIDFSGMYELNRSIFGLSGLVLSNLR